MISKIENRLVKYFKNRKKLNKISQKIKHHLSADHGQLILFFVTIFAIDSAIPDFIVVGIVRKKLNFRLFLLPSIIGKTIVYAPVIFI
jgi:membrane protein YqaA with SNARE-associated domain